MSIKINDIVLNIEEPLEILKERAAKMLNIPVSDIMELKILKESIDARRKNSIKFDYSIAVKCENENKILKSVRSNKITEQEEELVEEPIMGTKKMEHRPVIVGMGPAGMFAGLLLAEKGYKPVIIERGSNIEKRSEQVSHFFNTGDLDINSNVQFGEGGAGTFSDGKLTTRIKDKRCQMVLREFVEAGAPEEILYMGKPHIGTDNLRNVVKNIREKIIKLGGEVKFNEKLDDIIIENGKLKEAIINGEKIPCSILVLAIGHSSRDTYEMLFKRGIYMVPKPFAIGVRAEHNQHMIDENQYGKYAGHPRLKAADYRLTYTSRKLNRGIYSFCMCPGGEVVAAASEEGKLVTNGMSLYGRNKDNANAALVVTVNPSDYNGTSPLSGMEFQRHYEELAYNLGGGGYTAPVQLIGDFLKDRVSTGLGNVHPTYRPGYEFRELKKCLPEFVIEGLKEGIIEFNKKIRGFAAEDAVLTGIETRTSAPLRIERNENLQSVSLSGLYPAGEGAGYAGGIISAAVDGIKVGERIMQEWTSID